MAQWGRIRQSYMSGKSYKELSEQYGVSVKTIQNHASKEGWTKEKGKIREEVGQKIHERAVRVRVRELEKLMDANGNLIDTLVDVTTKMQGDKLLQMVFDRTGSMKNMESLAKAIQTAVQTQRDLYKLPTLDQEYRKKEAAQRKRENKAKLEIEREKLEIDRQKAAGDDKENEQEIWQVVSPDGTVVDG